MDDELIRISKGEGDQGDLTESSPLMVTGTEIVLPTTRTIDLGKDEDIELVSEVIPENVAPILKQVLRSHYEPLKLWHLLFAVVFIGGVLTGFLYFIPSKKLTIVDAKLKTLRNCEKQYLAVCEKAESASQAGKYRECLFALSVPVDLILDKKTSLEQSITNNDRLLQVYFNACKIQWKMFSAEERQAIRQKIQVVSNACADTYQWQVLRLFFTYDFLTQSVMLDPKVNSRTNDVRVNESHILAVHDFLAKLDKEQAQMQALSDRVLAEKDDVAACVLPYTRARILVYQWLILGGRCNWKADKDDPGVAQREEAYQLLQRIIEEKKDLENHACLHLQKCIVEKLLAEDSFFKKLYFKGERQKTSALKKELLVIKDRLKR